MAQPAPRDRQADRRNTSRRPTGNTGVRDRTSPALPQHRRPDDCPSAPPHEAVAHSVDGSSGSQEDAVPAEYALEEASQPVRGAVSIRAAPGRESALTLDKDYPHKLPAAAPVSPRRCLWSAVERLLIPALPTSSVVS
ncbi:hypothetical protein PSEUDO9AG_40860 [Pseudomonas sp. 9Ag]|nr:hypothetical protein PSEUDO9AG_40860 [Pseudomonas sp. 9Ag]